jgi:phospholipid/cholesterol/gamma-HCH transport system permease protein
VLPRVAAISLAVPCLVVFSNLVGWLGGALVAAHNERIAVPWDTFFSSLRDGVDTGDVLNGLIKSFVFAVCIGVICCHQGLTTIGGPRGIGRSVTKAVVNSLVLVLILDYVLTRLLLPFNNAFGI